MAKVPLTMAQFGDMSARIIKKLKDGAPKESPASVITLDGAFALVQLAQQGLSAPGIVDNASLATRQAKLRIATISTSVIKQLKQGATPLGPASTITLDDAFFLIPFARRGLQATLRPSTGPREQ